MSGFSRWQAGPVAIPDEHYLNQTDIPGQVGCRLLITVQPDVNLFDICSVTVGSDMQLSWIWAVTVLFSVSFFK